MDDKDFDSIIQSEAAAMATSINGGDWHEDYTEAQRVGWCLKVEWSVKRYCGINPFDIIALYGDSSHERGGPPPGLMQMDSK